MPHSSSCLYKRPANSPLMGPREPVRVPRAVPPAPPPPEDDLPTSTPPPLHGNTGLTENTYTDHVISTMLSLQYLQQKMGLAKHILTQTTEFIDHFKQHMYSPVDITHTGSSDTNPLRRISCFSHLSSRQGEESLTDKRTSENMAGQWAGADDIPSMNQQPVSGASSSRLVPSWMFHRVSHTLSATTGWSRPCFWLTACESSPTQPLFV